MHYVIISLSLYILLGIVYAWRESESIDQFFEVCGHEIPPSSDRRIVVVILVSFLILLWLPVILQSWASSLSLKVRTWWILRKRK